jgi:TPP-dependent pyruvate/acetoin dehydrogenase alpha subunit
MLAPHTLHVTRQVSKHQRFKEKTMPDEARDPIEDLNKGLLIDLYEMMLKIRTFEKVEQGLLTREQEGFAHTYLGEEAIATGVCANLTDQDYITSTHRGHGHLIAKGGNIDRMMAELYGKSTGYCKGKSGSLHVADFSIGVLGANGIVSASLSIAVGAGYSIKLRGTDQVAVAFFGDGAMTQGQFHEAANLAAIWDLPVVFALENNQWVCGSNVDILYKPSVREDLSRRAAAYGMKGVSVDGNDVVAVYLAAKEAVERARRGEGPTLLNCVTYRMDTHFVGDIDTRSPEEIEEWAQKDPVERFERRLFNAEIISGGDIENKRSHAAELVETAVEFGRQSPPPDPEVALEDVYMEVE